MPRNYLVYNSHCRISSLNPYKWEVMRHFNPIAYNHCKTRPPLTQVRYDLSTQGYVLSVDPIAFPSYNVGNTLSCCYQDVERINETNVSLTPCQAFTTNAQLSNTTDSIIVSCYSEKEQIYINGHPTIPERQAVRIRLNQWAHKDRGRRVPSVLMIGIDSISRVNLIRAMPKTAQYLYDNDWFELAGYNKIDDNTFPNIMALMVGYNLSNAMKHCSPYKVNGLDKCDFIWKLFKEHGYVTAYGEDAVKINTFNYLKKGFQQPPVDYYLRPYLSAAEKLLGGNIVLGLPHCVGFETEAEHVYNYALEFAKRYRNDSFFGFFWTNTHSHSDISQTSSMDDYLRGYLQRLVSQGTMEHSIVVFFSDHGLRFGPTRATWSGHVEERLPFLFIWLPPFMRKAHPEFVQALQQNRNRLTTPYDLHITLKHILSLSGRIGSLQSLGGAKDCPKCQSLLQPVTLSRSCEDVAIADHWCTCWDFQKYDMNSNQLTYLAERVVNYINDYVSNFDNGSLANLCEPLSLGHIQSAYKAQPNEIDDSDMEMYWLIFDTSPNNAYYETTVRYNRSLPEKDNMLISRSPSRLDGYYSKPKCVKVFSIEKYCHCRR
ncbi:GH23499 [Drosophila grimshawi]|uniref:GH23499 n=1 Tax=Drosophila grimshawi TaxID=7222 RepID=B4K3H9_DROGR|nr:GH23499 [Drosophila grimshawi]